MYNDLKNSSAVEKYEKLHRDYDVMSRGKTTEIGILHEKLQRAMKENSNNSNVVQQYSGGGGHKPVLVNANEGDRELVLKLREENSRLRAEIEDSKKQIEFFTLYATVQ